ncbi:chemotaxis protein CheB [Spirosoma agri]|uniref:protein-glutamate methylesterase n=1 Tax=Spirosoma agri TaxID=1987381 RepID=A0A6M0IQ75_9BACT|nr:chemotaxis protein CheB [Spirosoma agri]NEU70122.1 chemotaxis protein CheB [Spirosoma agri]
MENSDSFYIVAIGVSAGGHEPLWDFFSQIPVDSGIAFIVIQHLNRDYASIADKLLAKYTDMPIYWATDQQQVRPNCVYMLPVNKMMTIEEGLLQLQDREVLERSNWAVDIFFRSLANGQKAKAIGIVLSGAGTDGTLGAIQIHNQQGTVMVQDPRTAQFSSMPRSAIIKDHPTEILAPKRLARALLDFVVNHDYSLTESK